MIVGCITTLILTIGGITLARSTSELISGDTLNRAVEIFKAIGHHNRLQLVNILLSGEFRVEQLADKLCLPQPSISNQLTILRLHGVLKSRRDGNKTYYSLANDSIKKILESIIADI